jgi:hypothetical protein
MDQLMFHTDMNLLMDSQCRPSATEVEGVQPAMRDDERADGARRVAAVGCLRRAASLLRAAV